MRMEELKRGFWGYQKEGVYRCITSMEEEFSARLMEKDAALAKLEEQYQARVRELEEALARAQEENRAQSRSQAAISEALLRRRCGGTSPPELTDSSGSWMPIRESWTACGRPSGPCWRSWTAGPGPCRESWSSSGQKPRRSLRSPGPGRRTAGPLRQSRRWSDRGGPSDLRGGEPGRVSPGIL